MNSQLFFGSLKTQEDPKQTLSLETKDMRKLSLNVTETETIDKKQEKIQFNEKQILTIIELLCSKGMKLFTSFSNNKTILEKFRASQLNNNIYLKIGLKRILYRLASDRRIGKNLRGLSKTILIDIENQIWNLLELEIKLFFRNEEINKISSQFENQALTLLSAPFQIASL